MSWKLTLLAAVAIVAIAGVAVAAKSGSKDVTLCAQKSDGALSLAAKGKCGKGEKKLMIAKQGPQGAAGSDGAPGAPGAPGTTASIQPEAVRLVAEPVAGGCAANPGAFCGSTGSGVHWASAGAPYAPVAYWKDAGGEVHLQGTIDAAGGAGVLPEEFFYLPPGYRPSGEQDFLLSNCAGGEPEPFTVRILASGLVRMLTFAANTCPSLDGIAFRP